MEASKEAYKELVEFNDVTFTAIETVNRIVRILVFNYLIEQEDGFFYPSLTDDTGGLRESDIQRDNRSGIVQSVMYALGIIARVSDPKVLGIGWINTSDQLLLREALEAMSRPEDLVDIGAFKLYLEQEWCLAIVSKIEHCGQDGVRQEGCDNEGDKKEKRNWGKQFLGELYPLELMHLQNVSNKFFPMDSENVWGAQYQHAS
ncbi:hypothetical protein BO79DRAFT_247743 [Aspergillus costaricaensis CBS 115574]|uniref:Uncharacterized protein n=1 Tax=Aspergillus costaricaensis CBS 115574 TaxID=1448317 RepID=A0ACD1I3G8_9EURO|nr:hypothetical protein BO79DRAFT_247743 [Aspergillus costaricaensis CBS 115574]RAK85093.1 hypothetical protein BO79DRAFT_247743 [Aspergillus costaricaensis CBS 115574]